MNTEMKKLYEFIVHREQMVDVAKDIEHEGKIVQVLEKQKLPIPIKCFIRRPNRAEKDDLTLRYDIEFSKLVKAGVLTRAMLAKEYARQGGIFTEAEDKGRSKIYEAYAEKIEEYQKKKTEDNPNSDEISKLSAQIFHYNKLLVQYENIEESLYNKCADTRARDKVINYIITNFCYIQEADKEPKLFFSGDEDEDRLDDFDEKTNSEDSFIKEAVQFFAFFVSLWYMNKANTPEEFAEFETNYRKTLAAEEETSEESPGGPKE